MTLRREINHGSGGGSLAGVSKHSFVTMEKRVAGVIMDESHTCYDPTNGKVIGTIFFVDVALDEPIPENICGLAFARPKELTNYKVPKVNDIVTVEYSVDGEEYYRETSDNHYPKGRKIYLYSNPKNIHNNISDSSLPLPKNKEIRDPLHSRLGIPPLPEESVGESAYWTLEFRGTTKKEVERKLNNYLISKGFPKGTKDRKAPSYTLYQASNNDLVLRYDDNKRNERKLTRYKDRVVDNTNFSPIKPIEGDNIVQNAGTSIRMGTSPPEKFAPWANTVTENPSDGNPNVGDPIVIVSVQDPTVNVGTYRFENPDVDASTIHVTSNHQVPFSPSNTNFDAQGATFTEAESVYDQLEKNTENVQYNNNVSEEDLTEAENIFASSSEIASSYNLPGSGSTFATTNLIGTAEIAVTVEDPVFAALEEAQAGGYLSLRYEYEGDDDPRVLGEYATTFTPDPNILQSDLAQWLDQFGNPDPNAAGSPPTTTPGAGNASSLYQWPAPADLNGAFLGKPITVSNPGFVYPTIGRVGSSKGNAPYHKETNPGYGEFGGYRGVKTTKSGKRYHRYHYGIDVVNDEGTPLFAIGDGTIEYINDNFQCVIGQKTCGGGWGNVIILKLNDVDRHYALYGHCRQGSNEFEVGNTVKKGDIIAQMGTTGKSSGPHLHFEIIETMETHAATKAGYSTLVDKTNTTAGKRNPADWFPLMVRGTDIKAD